MSATGHANCNHAYKRVKCDRCGREFTCLPGDDFYCAAEGDHCCEACLLGGRRLAGKVLPGSGGVGVDVPGVAS